MKEVDIKTLLFRASSMGAIMTGKDAITETQIATLLKLDEKISSGKELTKLQSESYKKLIHKRDNPSLSLTTQRELVKMYREKVYGRREQIESKYLTHGIECEEDAITLYALFKGRMYHKNKTRLNDTHFTGEFDLSDNMDVLKSKETIDTKASYSLFTLPCFLDKVDSNYYWQGMTYMALTGAEKHTVAHCLVNHTFDELYRGIEWLRRKHKIVEIESDEFKYDVMQLERNMIFDRGLFATHYRGYDFYTSLEQWQDEQLDIPIEKRVVEFTFERDDQAIQAMRDRVDECREWLIENYRHL